ncbi:hypothetical protein [Ralstonia pseudosolanacearum]|uniref:Transmembrane protein n=1 Tax=Ralstonia solanacearum TaxID=305 RepID=A0A0S4WAH1_RALSL|nr:hypothetical protein [Ralstonia pseudosolanacearum]CUV43733.1 conserved protein of unknown function [Ralstonia solanacearum]MDO3505630.1 hypothetical protein [Ralstonia pseudosolanacearum]MDO3511576.1 hypothetical protein [Ralstonia pseudosolanacearum]MDO3535323.1 hypothetical protein [Ralstonia pseudosolanacearum]MDO3561320.1 hypothetical protein [Ralstonia pseudosolanacearum]
MRLPASPTAHPSDPAEMSGLAEPASDAAETPAAVADALPGSRWRRAMRRLSGGAFLSVAPVLIAVGGAIYIGMAHAPWLDHLMARTPSAAKDAANVAATAVSPSAVGAPDAVSAARDRMDARVYAQVPTASARTAAQAETAEEAPAPGRAAASRRHHRVWTRHVRRADAWDSHWYAGS